jgi:uncharacterized protein involved in exopolysaccharide biosynthesis
MDASSASNPKSPLFEGLSILRQEIWTVALVFIVIAGLGVLIVFSLGARYTANASLLMQLGQDYVFVPRSGDAARTAIATIDEVVQSEVEILKSEELKRRVIQAIGYKILLPDQSALWYPQSEGQRQKAEYAALKHLTEGFVAATAPDINVVRLSYKHENAQTAALVLNRWIELYQIYRLDVFVDRDGPLLLQQKQAFEAQLLQADLDYQDFLNRNGVADYVNTRLTFNKLYEQLIDSRYGVDEAMDLNKAKLANLTGRLTKLSPEISVQRDLDLSVPIRMTSLRQQKQELLARYRPDAQPVRDIEAQINALQGLMNSGKGVGEKEHRLGVNPYYQDAMTQKFNTQSDVASLIARRNRLDQSIAEVKKKLEDLNAMEAQYNSLSAQRESLQTNIRNFTNRLYENQAAMAIAKGSGDSVRVVEKARPPEKPTSLRRPVLIFALVFGLITALCAGLVRGLLRRPSNATTQSDRPASKPSAKALGLPVLGQARMKS